MRDRELIIREAGELRRHSARVRMFLPADAGIFAADEMLQDIVGFNLMLAIDGAIDLAAELLSAQGVVPPRLHRQAFEALAREGLVEPALAERLADAADLRQLLKHAHSGFDWARVHADAPRHLETLARFVTLLMEQAEAPVVH
ncbi:MAG TPA: DUF86 domain-containing protein [Polyangia bacterium]|jgi:uncharacterized protein YutE (UPF0331/DUF86 family)